MKRIVQFAILFIICISLTACYKAEYENEDIVETTETESAEVPNPIVIDDSLKEKSFEIIDSFMEELKVTDYEIVITDEEQYCYIVDVNGTIEDKSYYGMFLISKTQDGRVTESKRIIDGIEYEGNE